MYEPSSVVPSDQDAAPAPELIAAILQRAACLQEARLLSFVPGQLRASA